MNASYLKIIPRRLLPGCVCFGEWMGGRADLSFVKKKKAENTCTIGKCQILNSL